MATTAEAEVEAPADQSNSGITSEALTTTLQDKLDASYVDIQDMSGGCGQMFEASIVSLQFVGKSKLARARLVNSTLKQEIAAIHAWSAKCYTPEEWEKKS